MLFNQSSSVHPVSDFRGGTLSVTDEQRTKEGQTKEILVSNFGYLTLFHITTHFILSQIQNFYSWWCFDIFYHPTFFIHQNVCTDLTYMWVQFKLEHLVFNCYINEWWERIHYFTFCDLNETFIVMSKFSIKACPQMNELIVQRKQGHIFSYHVPKRPKALKKTGLWYSKFQVPKRTCTENFQ